jgi:hypothetical protein
VWETWPAVGYLVNVVVSPFRIAGVWPGFEEGKTLMRGRRALVGLRGVKLK